MSERAKEVMEVDKINSLGDKGYYDGDDIMKCEQNGVTCYVEKPAKEAGAQTKDAKAYCNSAACACCVLREVCCKNTAYRVIVRSQNQDVLDRVAERTVANKELYKKRGRTVEHPFGTIKAIWGYRNFLCKGFKMVNAEMALACLAYNFRRVVNIFAQKKQKPAF